MTPRPLRDLPGSRRPCAAETLSYLVDPTGFFERARRRHGPIFRAHVLPYGDQIFVGHHAAVREVLTADPRVLRGGEANAVLLPVVGAGSVSSLDGDEHLARRRLLAGALQGLREDGRAPAIGAITRRELGALPIGRPIALQPALRRVTMKVMLRAVFGDAAGPGVEDIGAALTRLGELGALPFSQLGAIPALRRRLGGLSPWAFFQRSLARVDAALYDQIGARRAHPGGGLLGRLVAARGQDGRGLTERELRDELMSLLGAGYDTTATALAWAFEQILLHPGARQRVEAEGAAAALDGPRPYLDAAIQETLRQRPVLPTVGRIAGEELTLGGYRVPAGSRVTLCVYLAHHDPYTYPDPERFLPERFLERRPDPYTWLPFGGGARRCPGMSLAQEQLRVVLSTALSEFTIELVHKAPSRPVFRGTTLAPAGGTDVVLRPRLGARGA